MPSGSKKRKSSKKKKKLGGNNNNNNNNVLQVSSSPIAVNSHSHGMLLFITLLIYLFCSSRFM